MPPKKSTKIDPDLILESASKLYHALQPAQRKRVDVHLNNIRDQVRLIRASTKQTTPKKQAREKT